MKSCSMSPAKASGITVRFVGADGEPGNPHHLVSSWKPGDPVWQGTIDGASGRDAGARRSPTASALRIRASRSPVYVFTEAEAASARLMPVGDRTDTGKKLLCPMPGLVVRSR